MLSLWTSGFSNTFLPKMIKMEFDGSEKKNFANYNFQGHKVKNTDLIIFLQQKSKSQSPFNISFV